MYKMDRNAACWCGSGKKYKTCHEEFDEKYEALREKGFEMPERKLIKNEAQIEAIRESAKINVAVLDYVAEHIHAGITTEEIDHWVYEETTRRGGIPAPLNYEGFPKSVCTSINDQVCHGIPSPDDELVEGDIVNVDCSTILNGYFSDSSRMFIIGETDPANEKLVKVARECVQAGLDQVKPSTRWRKRTATALSARSAAMAWVSSSTRIPSSAMSPARAPAWSWRPA